MTTKALTKTQADRIWQRLTSKKNVADTTNMEVRRTHNYSYVRLNRIVVRRRKVR